MACPCWPHRAPRVGPQGPITYRRSGDRWRSPSAPEGTCRRRSRRCSGTCAHSPRSALNTHQHLRSGRAWGSAHPRQKRSPSDDRATQWLRDTPKAVWYGVPLPPGVPRAHRRRRWGPRTKWREHPLQKGKQDHMPPIGCRHPHAHECSRPASPSHTTAGEAVAVQSVPGVAGAFEGAGGVAAVVLTAPVLDCALIHICGAAGRGNGHKAGLAKMSSRPLFKEPPPPCVTFRRVAVSLRGPGRSPVRPFARCVGSLRSVGRCGWCSRWCRFRARGAQWLVCRGCAGCGGMCRLRISSAQR